MRKFIYILMLAPMLLGCSSFLDINPKGEVVNKDMFSNATGFEDALYGVYTGIRDKDMYGERMNLFLPEIMAVNFIPKDLQGPTFIATGNLDYREARAIYNPMWKKSYEVIGHINNILINLESYNGKKMQYRDIYQGEALALRALIHFDLVRFFGVDYSSTDNAAKSKAIPYVKTYDVKLTPRSSVAEVYRLVLEDLFNAETLMKDDEGLLTFPRNNIRAGFTSSRIIHMNLYAVQALIARVYWAQGDLENAAKYAYKVIESNKFQLMATADLRQPERGVLNMKETIFGIYSTEYAKSCYNSVSKVTGSSAMNVLANVKDIYTSTQGAEGLDLRVEAWFGAGENVDLTCTKLINDIYKSSDSEPAYRGRAYLGVNMIRIPEMYYIMAESLVGKDNTEACKYIDAVLEARGVTKFGVRNNGNPQILTMDDIFIERRKEFWGEGQHWFNMKRLRKDIVVNPSLTLSGNRDATYTLLRPTAEDEINFL